jgi:hypothetical protein
MVEFTDGADRAARRVPSVLGLVPAAALLAAAGVGLLSATSMGGSP